MSEHVSLGPRLADVVKVLLINGGYTNRQCAREFGVGVTWLSNFLRNCDGPRGNAEALQRIYEQITGEPLIKMPRKELNPVEAPRPTL